MFDAKIWQFKCALLTDERAQHLLHGGVRQPLELATRGGTLQRRPQAIVLQRLAVHAHGDRRR